MSKTKQIKVLEETVCVQWMQKEPLNNPEFNRVEFEAVKNESDRNLTKTDFRIHHGCKWPGNSGRLSIE